MMNLGDISHSLAIEVHIIIGKKSFFDKLVILKKYFITFR